MTNPARRVARQLKNAASLARQPLYSPPGHYYSPVAGVADYHRAESQRAVLAQMLGLDMREDEQLSLADQLGPYWSKLPSRGGRYTSDNRMFGLADAAVYFSVLHHTSPRRIIEVGSGFSSAVALDFRDSTSSDLDMTFIEPYPDRLLGLLHGDDLHSVSLLRKPVQDVPLETFDSLTSGDILFIDSTHVSKSGSDVNWLFFAVLPRLRPGVIVHLHDIFFPFEYPEQWLRQRRSWNENYLLRAYLMNNSSCQVLLFNSWLWQQHEDVIGRYLPAAVGHSPGSFWLRCSS